MVYFYNFSHNSYSAEASLFKFKKINFDSKFLIIAPFAFLILSLISTFYAILAYQKSIGFLGFTESLEVITAALISLISFNLINQNTKALKWIVISLIAMPALNMIAVLILTNQHVEFLGGNSGYTLVWYLGYGNRFIGLASNSNLIAIQAVVTISFIIAYFDSSKINQES